MRLKDLRQKATSIATTLVFAWFSQACALSTHPHAPDSAGLPARTRDVVSSLSVPGPIAIETVTSASWAVGREGLLNLDHPVAKAHHLQSGDEPIEVYFHVLRHPTRGTYLVDTGFERALRDDPSRAALGGIVRSYMGIEKIRFVSPLGDYLASHHEALRGVFLTHAHLDHVGGMPDLPKDVPFYTGPNELGDRAFLNMFVQGSTDRALAGLGTGGEWRFRPDADGYFDGVVDVFGDRSLFAIWVPGHSVGSTAYLVRTPRGPVLLVGDACHTRFGWEQGVEPGSFSSDRQRSVGSLARLRKLVAVHPNIDVRLGHQALPKGEAEVKNSAATVDSSGRSHQ